MTKICGECCGFSGSENRCLLLGGRGKAYADNEACRRFVEKKTKVITKSIKSGMDYISRQVHYITETADTIDVKYRVIYRGKETTMTAAQIEAIMTADFGMALETGEPILEVIDERFKRKNNQ